jgi:hypothetical protein
MNLNTSYSFQVRPDTPVCKRSAESNFGHADVETPLASKCHIDQWTKSPLSVKFDHRATAVNSADSKMSWIVTDISRCSRLALARRASATCCETRTYNTFVFAFLGLPGRLMPKRITHHVKAEQFLLTSIPALRYYWHMDYRERQALDRYITGNYGENQFRGEAAFEVEVDRLLNLRDAALKANSGFQVQQSEAELDKIAPEWREWL